MKQKDTINSLNKIKIFLSFAIFLFLGSAITYAQDKGFVHTATAANITGATTTIDNPELNGNPNAKVMFCQRGGGAENDNPTGIYYNTATSKWAIFNENQVDMANGAKFNIYIADDSVVTTHIADASNTTNFHTELDGFLSEDYLFFNNYWNPNGTYNPYVYGTYFSNPIDKRILYVESLEEIPLGVAFKIMKGIGTSAIRGSEVSIPSNIDGNSMELDHPALNNNPDAVFLYSHYYGIGGNSTYLPYVTRAIYHQPTNRWRIYAYGAGGFFPEGVWIDFIIPDEILGTENITSPSSKIAIFPNPAKDIVNISTQEEITSIQVYNITGQQVLTLENEDQNLNSVDVSSLEKGVYLLKIEAQNNMRSSHKLIKQ
ncbi:T9SS type A sorting domain-containing protein [Aequorivita todarodis]|uniref:T9SS type A sorting domain-containing protein n=1 Tax=Aequorivita todarodis TaxID=2036821 RepID=UPI002350EFD3|nr:T9SS type A sorting domain-containing protein [Aequorivita todarodis]MDC7999766.1 T9SS type A sorting domain-containing protein [Aequorivita todarodis]